MRTAWLPQDADPAGRESDAALLAPLLGPALLYGIVAARRTPCLPATVRKSVTGEEGESGQRGEGDCEREREEEEEEEVCVLARTSERKRGKEPVRFHMRVSSPPSKSSSSEEEPSRSVSPSPPPPVRFFCQPRALWCARGGTLVGREDALRRLGCGGRWLVPS
jgi:hypothetical protein